MKKKQYSIQRLLTKNLIILLFTSLVSLLFFGIFSYWTGVKQIESSNKASMSVYSYTLQTEMEELSKFIQNMCFNDTAYRLLSTGHYTDVEKIINEHNLRNIMKSKVAPYSGLLIFSDDTNTTTSMYQFGSLFPAIYAKQQYDFKEELKNYWITAEDSQLGVWQTYANDYFSVLMYACQYNGLYMCSVIELNYFTPPSPQPTQMDNPQLCFLDQKQIISNQSGMQNLQLNYQDLTGNKTRYFRNPVLINTLPITDSNFFMASVMPVNYVGAYFQAAFFLILLMLFVFMIMLVIMVYSFKDILRYPIQQISSAAKSIEQNHIGGFLDNNQSNIIEFQQMNKALGNLIQQKILLEQENQLEKNEKTHAMLQYFQLQTRSHFFINCLKSLYSMLEIKEYEKMQRMILSFSNHLRYIFHDNLKLVSLKSELDEVNDYYNIMLMDRSKPLLLMQDAADELMHIQVPPLLIQTFLENSIKYNEQSDKLLCFQIKIELSTQEERPVLQIKLSDNGIGYDQSILEKLNCNQHNLYEDYQVGITNLKKRVQLIYKTGFQFVFFNAPSGGACELIYLPLEEL